MVDPSVICFLYAMGTSPIRMLKTGPFIGPDPQHAKKVVPSEKSPESMYVGVFSVASVFWPDHVEPWFLLIA